MDRRQFLMNVNASVIPMSLVNWPVLAQQPRYQTPVSADILWLASLIPLNQETHVFDNLHPDWNVVFVRKHT